LSLACEENEARDYPPSPLADLGLHDAPLYVARDLMGKYGVRVLLAHPRLGQPAIRRVGETIDVGWIEGAAVAAPAQISLSDGVPLGAGPAVCDPHGICRATTTLPPVALGLHGLCVQIGADRDCSPNAIAVVDHYADPALVAHISDPHVGDDDPARIGQRFQPVIDRVNALVPPPDFAIFTGDGPDRGFAGELRAFRDQLARLAVPVFVVTGNHDFDNGGIEGYLLEIGPELDYVAAYGGTRLVGFSSGQDLDEISHPALISESTGPDGSQMTWLSQTIPNLHAATIVFAHHPIYNGLFGTVGPAARDALRGLVTRDSVIAYLSGHTHVTAVFDADGDSRGLSLDGEDDVPLERRPLHYTAARCTNGAGGFALLHLGLLHVDYRWLSL
jgi:hypothetical protein